MESGVQAAKMPLPSAESVLPKAKPIRYQSGRTKKLMMLAMAAVAIAPIHVGRGDSWCFSIGIIRG